MFPIYKGILQKPVQTIGFQQSWAINSHIMTHSSSVCSFALYVLWSPDKDYYLPFSHRSMPDPWFCGSKYLSIPMWFIAIGRWMWNTSAINLPQRVYLYSTLTHFSISVKFGESTTTISLPPINSFVHSIIYCNNNLNASQMQTPGITPFTLNS